MPKIRNAIDEVDVHIIELCLKKDYTVYSLAKEIGMSYQNLFHRLKKLGDREFIKMEILRVGEKPVVKPTSFAVTRVFLWTLLSDKNVDIGFDETDPKVVLLYSQGETLLFKKRKDWLQYSLNKIGYVMPGHKNDFEKKHHL